MSFEEYKKLNEINASAQALVELAGSLFEPAPDGGLMASEIYLRPRETFFNKAKGLPFEDPRYD